MTVFFRNMLTGLGFMLLIVMIAGPIGYLIFGLIAGFFFAN